MVGDRHRALAAQAAFPLIAVGWSVWYAASVWTDASRITSYLLVVPTAVLVTVLAIVCVVSDVRKSDGQQPVLSPLSSRLASRQAVLLVATGCYVLALPIIGYWVASLGYIAAVFLNTARSFELRTVLGASLVSTLTVASIWWAFSQVLGVNLP